MTFHFLSLAQHPLSEVANHVAFINLGLDFCKMLKNNNKKVIAYGAYGSKVECEEYVEVVSHKSLVEYQELPSRIKQNEYDSNLNVWKEFNHNCYVELNKRFKHGDLIILASSPALYPCIENKLFVEAFCGYEGVGSINRIFPSQAWMHYILGQRKESPKWFDRVIPHFLNEEDYIFNPNPKDYFLFLGRLNYEKGFMLAIDFTKKTNNKIVVAGTGLTGEKLYTIDSPHVSFFGRANKRERIELMSNAKALIAPTTYAEPFGLVLTEANACGTPVICTNWGAFPEIIKNGINGYRCNMERDFLNAIKNINSIDRAACRKEFDLNFSLKSVWPKFESYFNDILELNGKGWYA